MAYRHGMVSGGISPVFEGAGTVWMRFARWGLRVLLLVVVASAIHRLLSAGAWGSSEQRASEPPRPDVVRGKGVLSFSSDVLQVVKGQADLFSGHSYWVVQATGAGDRCVWGHFLLKSLGEARLEFQVDSREALSTRLQEFARTRFLRVHFEVLDSAALQANPAAPCERWLRVREDAP